jgi:predicted metal-dependent hydrolase
MRNQVFIDDIEVNYEVVHRRIKNPRLEVKTGTLVLILPEGYPDHLGLVKKYKNWIYTKMSLINSSENLELNLNRNEEDLKENVNFLVTKYCSELDLQPNKIVFRKMRARWGSCDSKGNLKFNKFMKYLPEDLVEYVVFHEVAHLSQFGHNNDFWKIIRLKYENHKELDQKLSAYWFAIKKHTNDFKNK